MKRFNKLLVTLFLFLLIGSSAYASDVSVYRLYNTANGEHLYTSDHHEVETLVASGSWNDEGTGWIAPETGEPVYRLYNEALQNHLYTKDPNEVDTLTSSQGWTKDNNGTPLFCSGGSVPIYRVYNEALRGLHHLTTDENEYNSLPSSGWKQEGPSLNAVAVGNNTPTTQKPASNGTLTLNLTLNYGDPNDPDLNIPSKVWKINNNYNLSMLNFGDNITTGQPDANGTIRIPNNLSAGDYLVCNTDLYLMAGRFTIDPSEVGKDITKDVSIDWQD